MPNVAHRSAVSRRSFLQALAVALGGTALAACSTGPAAQPAATPKLTTAAQASPIAPAATQAAAATQAPATASNLIVTAIVRASSNPAPPRDQNPWWQDLEKKLGIARLDIDFTPSTSYNEKLAVLLAGGSLPDLVFIEQWTPVLLQAAAQGAFMPWSDVVGADYKVKNPSKWPGLASLPARCWRNSAVNGKVYGVPAFSPAAGKTLFVRQDWMKKLGLGTKKDTSGFKPELKAVIDKHLGGTVVQPTSKAEIEAVWKAFTENDPDGNGKKDTLGFLMAQPQGSATWGPQGTEFFLNAFAVPQGYAEQADGSLVPSLYDQAFKEAIAWASDVYKMGVIDPDFQAINAKQRDQKMAEGKGGSWFHVVSAYASRYRAMLQANKHARLWGIDPISAVPGRKAVTYNSPGWESVHAISAAAAKDPAKREVLMRIYDFYADPKNRTFILFGDEGKHHTVDKDGQPQKKPELGDFNSDMISGFGSAPYEHYTASTPNPVYTVQELNAMYAELGPRLEALGVDDPSWGLYSDVYRQRGAALEDFYNISITNFITGKTPMSDWEKFVAEWKSKGGEAIVADLSKLHQERKRLG